MENVVEEPPHVDMLGWGHISSGCEEVHDPRDERMLRIGV